MSWAQPKSMKRTPFKVKPSSLKRSAMKRGEFKVRVPGTARTEKPKYSTLKKVGPRAKKWQAAWRFLKPELDRREIHHCEFRFIPHVCSEHLTPAHSKKRGKMKGNDIYAVALACTVVHQILDEVYSHAQMYEAVMQAIDNRGGLILPKAA